MSTYSDRRRAVVDGRQREVFRDWLAALPATGWAGTVSELHDDLNRFLGGHRYKHGVTIQTGSGLSKWLATVDDLIRAAGRQLQFARTKSERRILISAASSAGV
jgi:hypothetical protein